jgi:hypothetical protein
MNIMDIITYDDLLRRLDNIITSLRTRAAANGRQTKAAGARARTLK